MRIAIVFVVAAALAGGCKKKNENQPAPASGTAAATADLGPMDPLVAEVHKGLSDFRDEMCSCKDMICADGVVMRMGQWLMKYEKNVADIDAKSTPAQIEAAKKISAEHDACARKLAGR